jgi:DHA2 family multidrug resistance protein
VDEMFRLSAWLFLALIVLVWLVKPARNGVKVDASAAH